MVGPGGKDKPKPPGTCITCPTGPAGPAGPAGPTGPVGPAGVDGKDGAPGVAGVNGKDGKDGAPGVNGVNGVDGKDGVASYKDSDKYEGGIAGAMAVAQIDHARNNGTMVGIGLASFESEEALAFGAGKSWMVNGEVVNEITLGVAGFISEETEGVGASLNFHFK